MKQVLFEEDGHFRVGTILSEAGNAFQVEAAHGKRTKLKAAQVLLRFDGQALASFVADAQRLAGEVDPQFLWEVCGASEFGFPELAREYHGREPTPQEATAVALVLHGNPVHFYKRGKGRYQAAPEENLKAALAGLEKKRRQQEQVDAWSGELLARRLPEGLRDKVDALLFKPDKMSLEWRALEQACAQAGAPPPRVLAAAGALAGPEDFFARRFAFEAFPQGLGFAPVPALADPPELPHARTAAFSIDDAQTTEIDDAFSVEALEGGRARIGIHIAAPVLFFGRGHPLEALARERLSTVYYPGGKVTMLPEEAIRKATLGEGRRVPAVSLYLDVDRESFAVLGVDSRLEAVAIADNLRLGDLDARMNEESVAAGQVEGVHGESLLLLWKLAKFLRAARGAGEERNDRPDYTFRVEAGRVSIEPRRRGTPVDTLVSELMIHVNSTWGRLLAERGYDAIYRNQRGIKTRMEVEPGSHEWLGVSHYAWTSSPLRRFADLANQRQLVAALGGHEPAYSREELVEAARHFETAYEAYAEYQRHMERYWTLRYLAQEGITESDASLIRDDLVRIEGLPLVCRAIGLPTAAPGERLRVAFGEPDLWEVHVPCRYAGKSP